MNCLILLLISPCLIFNIEAADYASPFPSHLVVETISSSTSVYVRLLPNGTYTGFVIDLLNLIAQNLNFTYTLIEQPDRIYGVPQSDGSWNGLFGDLIAGRADLIARDLSETAARHRAVDFTTPFGPSNLRILIRRGANISNINYVVQRDTSYQTYLENSQNPADRDIWANIQANNGLVTDTNQQLVDRVLASGVAAIGDGNVLAAAVAANADRLELASRIIVTDYLSFAVRLDSPMRDPINIAILTINENGDLQSLFNKYQLS